MELEIILKIILASVAVITVGINIYNGKFNRKSRLQEGYKFSKSFLEEVNANPNLHPFVKEIGYQAIAGSKFINSEEIAYLLSLKNPGQCLDDYLFAKRYLKTLNKTLDTKGELHLEFHKIFISSSFRQLLKILFFILYVFFAGSALMPIFFPKFLILLVITIPGFGYYGTLALVEFSRILRAERLVKNQNKLPTHSIKRSSLTRYRS